MSFSNLEINWEGIPGGLVVRILDFHCHGPGSIPGRGTEILKPVWHALDHHPSSNILRMRVEKGVTVKWKSTCHFSKIVWWSLKKLQKRMNWVHLTSFIQVQVGQKLIQWKEWLISWKWDCFGIQKIIISKGQPSWTELSEFFCHHAFEIQIQFHKFKWPLCFGTPFPEKRDLTCDDLRYASRCFKMMDI